MAYSKYTKLRIISYRRLGYRAYIISKKLREGIKASRRGVQKMLAHFKPREGNR